MERSNEKKLPRPMLVLAGIKIVLGSILGLMGFLVHLLIIIKYWPEIVSALRL